MSLKNSYFSVFLLDLLFVVAFLQFLFSKRPFGWQQTTSFNKYNCVFPLDKRFEKRFSALSFCSACHSAILSIWIYVFPKFSHVFLWRMYICVCLYYYLVYICLYVLCIVYLLCDICHWFGLIVRIVGCTHTLTMLYLQRHV